MRQVAGLLLTGGASRRLGVDKATSICIDGERLVDRATRVLTAVAAPVLEVGPGVSGLSAVRENTPGEGPLAALVAGASQLDAIGFEGPVVLFAVDLPFVSIPLLELIAGWPGDDSVVPSADGEPQVACARYAPLALGVAAELVAQGQRSLRSLLEVIAVTTVDETRWRAVAVPHAFADLDTPDDLRRFGLVLPT